MSRPDALAALVAAALVPPEPPDPGQRAARRIAQDIVARHGAAVEAVLFYGACQREGDAAGLLDLYVLTAGQRAFHGRALPALANALLPPTVLHWRLEEAGAPPLAAKVAVLTARQFARRMRPGSLDTTLWARFCQPATLVHARDAAARARTEAAVAAAVTTAAAWALRLAPPGVPQREAWRHLFAATFGAELRSERAGRADRLLEAAPEWYDRALPAARARLDAHPPRLGAWALRRACGKALNAARLVKAAFTFAGGADYLISKIERHAGQRVEVTPWQRRHPILAAPLLLWRFARRGLVR